MSTQRRPLAIVAALGLMLWLNATVDAAVLYRSKDDWFRLELRGYVKNFLMIQTGGARTLPLQPPTQLAALDAWIKAQPGQGGADLQSSWDGFRRQLDIQGTDLLRVRTHLKMKFGSSVSFQIAYEIRPQITAGPGEFLSAIPAIGRQLASSGLAGGGLGAAAFTNFDDRFFDLPRNLFHTYSVRLDHEIDRFFVSWALPWADITIGRQSIVFGVAQIFRPTDVLAPFSPQEIDKLERRGVDAIKIEIPLGDLAELMLVGVLQRLRPAVVRDINQPGYFDDVSPGGAARIKLTAGGFDFFAMGGYVQKDIVAGLGFSGSLFGAGVRGEAVYRYRIPAATTPEANPDGVFSASLGIDYNIGSKVSWLKLIISLEYFFNGAGTTDPKEYLNRASGYRFQRGEVFNLGAHYLALALQWEWHPLLKFSGFLMINLFDQSVLVAPSLEYSIKEDVSLFFSAYIGAGAQPDASFQITQQGGTPTETIALQLKSEFGTTGTLFLLGMRAYF